MSGSDTDENKIMNDDKLVMVRMVVEKMWIRRLSESLILIMAIGYAMFVTSFNLTRVELP